MEENSCTHQVDSGLLLTELHGRFMRKALEHCKNKSPAMTKLDYALKQCGGFAMGPYELTDLIGQDVNFSVTQSVYQEFFTSHAIVQASFKKNWSMELLGA
ncbi:3-hydroxyacyl-CoA dehydrogenase family protein [Acinetobacter baumannii]